MKKGNQSNAASLRQKAEELLKEKQLKTGLQLSEAETQKLIHELQVHQVELELQNEKLALAKEQAEVASKKYTELYDFVPSGYFTLSNKGEIIALNLCGSQMLGKERSHIKNKLFVSFVSDDAKPGFNQFLEKIFTSKAKESYESALSTNVNSRVYVHLIGIVTKKGEQCLISAFDITERKHAEDALAREQYLMNALMTNLPDYIYFKDKESRFIKINSAHAQSFRLSVPEEAIGKTDFDFFSEEHARQAYNDEQAIIQTGKPLIKEEKETWTDRPDTWVSTIKLPLVNHDGNIVGTFGISKDITERKFAEDLLRINVERLQELNVLQYRLQYPSHIGEKLKLITDAVVRIMGADFARIWMIKPGDRCQDGCIYAQATEGEHVCRFRNRCLHLMASSGRYTHTDGQVHARVPFGCYKIGKVAAAEEPKFLTNNVTTDPRVHNNAWAKELGLMSFAGYRLGDTADTPLGVLALFSKKAISPEEDSFLELIAHSTSWVLHTEWNEAVLRESEEKLSTLFASMTEMVVLNELVFNQYGKAVNYRIIDCNNAFTTITGIKKENAIGKLATEVYQTDALPHLEEFAQVAMTGKPYKFTEYSNDIDKHLIVSVISPKNNQFSTFATDITVIQQIQEEIKAKNKELENYLYVASHDLRSPLVNIQGFSQRFIKQSDAIKNALNKCQLETETKQDLEKITNEDIPKTLNFILSNVTKMENLISGLLQISRAGRFIMSIRKIDMNHLIKTIIAGYNFQITELSAKVVIEDLSDCYGDENLLNQLFSNIISNALKYRDSSRQLVIEIASQVQFNKLIYSIKDSGIGIEPSHLEKIWDVFYRVDPVSNVAGEGIGLSLSRRITDKHKGKIWVASEVGKGSIFYVELQKNEFSE